MAVPPTTEARVGSGYGERISSRTGRRTFHAGWDFVAPRGTPIFAADAGRAVIVAREQPGGPYRGYGNAVIVEHPDETYVLYAHLDRADVMQGDTIAAGQQIGVAGNTTNGKFPRMPPHLHLEVRHLKSDGSLPFPGAYGRFNLDPKDWFERRGLVVGNRWARPPGTLVPSGSAEVSGVPVFGGAAASGPVSSGGRYRGLGARIPEWWETTFPAERAPEGQGYRPGVELEGNAFWDWAGLIAGAVVFNGVYLLATGNLPTLKMPERRRRERWPRYASRR